MSDYRAFKDKIGADLASASASAASYDRSRGSKIRVRNSDLEALVPAGASVEFLPMSCSKLKFGDIIFVRQNNEFLVRRFVSFKISKGGGATITVARAQPAGLEQHHDSALAGKIIKVDCQGRQYDPHSKESFLTKWRNEWSCFGTSSMLRRFFGGLSSLGRMVGKK